MTHVPPAPPAWRRRLSAAICLAVLALAAGARGQGTAADYERSRGLAELARQKVYRATVEPHWFARASRFWYRNDLPGGGREFVLVNADAGTRAPAFDAPKLAAALARATGQDVRPERLPVEQIAFEDPDGPMLFEAAGKAWACDLTTYALSPHAPLKPAAPAPPRRPGERRPRRTTPSPDSPDGRWVAFVKEANVYLRPGTGGEAFALSHDGSGDDAYTGEFFWSPDSTRLVALRTRAGQEHKVYLVQSSPPQQVQPKLLSYDYLKPGDRIPITKPHLFDVPGRKQVAVGDSLFPNPWAIERVKWDEDSARFTFLYNQRGHQVLRLVAVEAATGRASAVIDEQSPTFIDYEGKQFLHDLDETGELIWMSERDGWNHLYLYDAKTAKVKNPITRGPWVVRGVDRVDEKKRQIWFRAGGIRPGQDPYYVHFCRANFDGTGLTVLTEGDGTHSVKYSPDGRYFIDTWSRVDQPPVNELRRSDDGKLVCALEQADASALLSAGLKFPERFVAKGRDGTTDIYGVIHRPTNFDPRKKYPVLEDIYAGPQGAFVPKSFSPLHRQQAMAELGFVVVQIDGMGTSERSKAFHDVCWKNLSDSGLPDRIAWLKAAAARDPALDLSHVGIYGTSAGGQSALAALLWHGDFYKAAVADCGCHDNRMDKIWWNELWMGWPVGPEYAANSNVVNAGKLQGKLLLIVGETDHNVDPASTMQVAAALIKADKDFDLLVIPNADHGQDGRYGERRRMDFFVRNLMGAEPRK